jgi:hypothetical protein
MTSKQIALALMHKDAYVQYHEEIGTKVPSEILQRLSLLVCESKENGFVQWVWEEYHKGNKGDMEVLLDFVEVLHQ